MLELNSIHFMDCLDGMKQLEDNSIDLIVTDPPYILDNGGGDVDYMSIHKIRKDLDDIREGFDIDTHLKEWERVLKKFHAFIFCSNKQISSLMKWGEDRGYSTNCLIWNKTNPAPFSNGTWIGDIEYCIHIRESGATFQGNTLIKKKVYRSSTVKSEFGHPTVKPLELIKNYIKIGSNENDIILDPFMGSGTTGAACINLDRQFIGFEISKDYHDIATDRIKRAVGNVGLFE